ncbi:MAG: DEAD/DEAH box helicase [Thaumarchaeota archaeon]|nr:DEAD/DEAH box helicase [Nitrososphaerota archaeon]
MIVLHAGEFEGGLAIWGEESADGAAPRIKTTVRSPSVYPFGADGRLAAALEEMVPGFAPADRAHEVAVWMPTVAAGPIPSSGIISEPPPAGAKAKVAPWSVTAYWLYHDEAVDLLCRVMGRHTLAAGVVVGEDLAYWAEAVRLAGSLVARQQFLPDMVSEGGSYWAVWAPVLEGVDAERFGRLAGRMPAAARALSKVGAARPKRPAAGVLRTVVYGMVDQLVRAATHRAAKPEDLRRDKFYSAHDRWLHALRYTDGDMGGHGADAAQVAAHIREWRRPVAASAEAPFRLCFRLEEPARPGNGTIGDTADGIDNGAADGRDSQWYVRYMVQPRADPSLMVPADLAWKDGAEAEALAQHGRNIREFLLASLGQAAGICPGIAAGLEGGGLAGHAADTAGAHRFLTEEAAALEQAGHAVLLPAWWTGSGTRLTARAKVRPPRTDGLGVMTLDTVFGFDWEVALGDQTMTVEELEELARLKQPLVSVRGQWLALDAEGIRSAIKYLKKGTRNSTLLDVLRMRVDAAEAPSGLEFDGVEASGPLGELLGQLDGSAKLQDAEPPEGFAGSLRPYQLRGYSWLAFLQKWGLGGCLADDMGLGKTIQVLAAVQLRWAGGDRRPTLVVCPTSVISNWNREAARFSPDLPVMVHHGPGRLKDEEFGSAAAGHAITVTSYGLAHRDEFLADTEWGGVVLDEAQNVKNPQTKQARAVRSLHAESRFALTGTPVENSVGDLWSIMEFLNPGLLGNREEFRRNFLLPIQAHQDAKAADRLRRATGPFVLRRLKTDSSIISDLPEKMEMNVFCSLSREQATLYASVLRDADERLAAADGIQRRGLVLATLSKLKQVCNHPAHFLGEPSGAAGRSGKMDRLAEMLEEIIAVGDQALVFTQFVQMGHMLKRHIQETFGREALFFHGGLPQGQRDRIIQQFQAGGAPVLILSLKAGGTGLNITAASHVFHFDRWWNPAVENQATDRAFRIGQTRNVQVYKFICAGTLEERINEMIERKKDIAERAVGAGEGWLTELSNDELRDVLALSAEAAG